MKRPFKSPAGRNSSIGSKKLFSVSPLLGDKMLPDPFSESIRFVFQGELNGIRSAMGIFFDPLVKLRHDNKGNYRTSLIAVNRGGTKKGLSRWDGFVEAFKDGKYVGHLHRNIPNVSINDKTASLSIHIVACSPDKYELSITRDAKLVGSATGQRRPVFPVENDLQYLPESTYYLQEIESDVPNTRKIQFAIFLDKVSCDGIDYKVLEDRVEYGLRVGGLSSGRPMVPAITNGTGFQTAIIATSATLPLMAFSANQVLPWPWTDIGRCGPIKPNDTVITQEGVIKYREWRALKRKWERFFNYVVPAVQNIHCPNYYVCPTLVLAILWDEMARGSCETSEWISDVLQEDFGGDPTCGPFQIRLSTAREIIQAFNIQTHHNIDADDDLQDALTEDLNFAATLVAYRICQLWNHWRTAGHDPCTPGGLGSNKITPSQLAAALYSQGLGQPKPNPGTNARSNQIVLWMSQIVAEIGFQPCDPCNPSRVIRHPGPLPEDYWNDFDWDDLTQAEQETWGRLGWDADRWNENSPAPNSSSTSWDELTEEQRDTADDLGYSQSSWDDEE